MRDTLSPPKVMTFSATDPTGGAGLQADVLTLASMYCHPISVSTAISIQDTKGVESLIALDSQQVKEQALIALNDIDVAVFKIGLLGSVDNIKTVSDILSLYPDTPVIIDPIITSGRGDILMNDVMKQEMINLLFPKATLITPNSIEAKKLVCKENENIQDLSIQETVRRLFNLGCENILITGGHEQTKSIINTLYMNDGDIVPFKTERFFGQYHGSGCTLAAAVAGFCAQEYPLREAVYEAVSFTSLALKNAFKIGNGQLIPDRFHWIFNNSSYEEDDNDKPTHH